MQTDNLIASLAQQLTPVRPMRAPMLRALLWLAVVAAVSTALIAHHTGLSIFMPRIAQPRVAVQCFATALTAITAIIAAFELSVPGRNPRWLWAPVAPLLLWLGASGLGCLQNGFSLHQPGGMAGDSPGCFGFIAGASVPLALALFWMLRRARPIAPLPVAALGTLGVAATAAFVLEFFHPFDVTVIDLTLHMAAVALVVLVGTIWRRALLASA
ncbi:MAG: NrsF family protein [Steroidobacteraceae bacterium]